MPHSTGLCAGYAAAAERQHLRQLQLVCWHAVLKLLRGSEVEQTSRQSCCFLALVFRAINAYPHACCLSNRCCCPPQCCLVLLQQHVMQR
jgi:hypothetical protein